MRSHVMFLAYAQEQRDEQPAQSQYLGKQLGFELQESHRLAREYPVDNADDFLLYLLRNFFRGWNRVSAIRYFLCQKKGF